MFKLMRLLFIMSVLWAQGIQAKKFATKYCEFELPPGWECVLEGLEWVCQSSNKERKREAIIILAAKLRGSHDSLDQYQAYLKKSKAFKIPGRKTQISEPKYASMKIINRHQWIDALHLASEVPGFYTRYLATVKEDLGIAVTFSVSRVHYASYQSVFDRMVSTLRVFRQRKATTGGNLKFKKRGEDLLGDDTTYIPDSGDQFGIGIQKKKGKKGEGMGDDLILLIVVVVALVGGTIYVIKRKKKPALKKKKKKKKKKKRPVE